MKKITLAAVCGLFATSAMAGGVDHLVSEFQRVDNDCAKLAQSFEARTAVKNQRQDSFDNDACYSWAVRTSMSEQPSRKSDILMAALVASQARAASVTEGAIEAGMAPMAVVARANEILPLLNDEISRGAIRAGVDPVVVTEATAAGKRKVEKH